LHLKGLAFDYRPIHLLKGEQHSEEYRKLNPLGGVPTLVHDGKVIPDSVAIVEYLEKINPNPSVLPEDSYLAARVRQVCQIINSSMHPMGNLKLMQYMEKNFGMSSTEQKEAWLKHWLNQGLTALETTAKEFSGKYFFGDAITMADLFLVPQIFSCQRFNVDLSPYPILTDIADNCSKLEAFRKAHPGRQIDTPEEFRIN
jgi:maleylacetoacetate isomerase/maleylpyruvate isomerase